MLSKSLLVAIDRMKYRRFKAAYRACPTDVFIVTYPKSGTSWVQMILYQLLSDGDMQIPHVNRFAPYLEDLVKGEARPMSDVRVSSMLRPLPRVSKTHLPYKSNTSSPCLKPLPSKNVPA
jgi:hypothetical protein